MPWEAILSGASAATIVLILGLLAVRQLIEGIVNNALVLSADRERIATEIDLELRESRRKLYAELWLKTGLLPLWPRSPDVTYEKLFGLSEEMKDWYFGRGGMFLSREAREAYGEVQKTIHQVIGEKKTGVIHDDEYTWVQEKCSSLRTQLTDDLLSRRPPLLER